MWLKIVVPLLAAAYVGYRVMLALEISRARRRGDTARVAHLTTHGFGFYRFVIGTVLVILCLLTILLVLEAR